MPGETAKHHLNNDTQNKSNGRNPLPALEDTTPDFARTTERIEENYPFFGRLHKLEDGHYMLKETIRKSDPKDIEWVKRVYKAGDYQLRLTADGEENRIDFSVSAVTKADTNETDGESKVIDEQFIANLRKDLKKELRADYEADIERLERRVDSLNTELDEKSRKLRDRTVELAEVDRKAAQTTREGTRALENEIDQLKEDKSDLKFEVFKLEQELEYADVEKNFSFVDMLKDAANDPDTMKMLAPVINRLFGGTQGQNPQPQPALNGNQQQNAEHRQNESESGESGENTSESQQNQQQTVKNTIQQFKTGVIQTVASAMVHGQPDPVQLKQLITSGINDLENAGIEIQPGIWVGIGKELIKIALRREITPETAAEKIRPVLIQIEGAKENLRYSPANMAANFLIAKYGIETTEAQKEFLIDVLKVFKESLDEPTQEPAE